jgi:glycosyltransferase involved in cell wall biosynthesis
MIVCFYFDNSLIKDVNCRDIEKGNPGIGGTEYLFITIPYFLNRNYGNQFDIVWLAKDIQNLPGACKKIKANSLEDAKDKAINVGCDIFVWRPLNSDYFASLDNRVIKLIAWEHNLPQVDKLNRLIELSNLARYICVGREHLDSIRGHKIYYKANYIYNGIDPENYSLEFTKNKRLIVYMGALNSRKGFHVIAKNWSRILSEIPDAKLEVIGSGDLYDRQIVLGKYSLAESEYERKYIVPYLVDNDSKIISSVKFHGTLGIEKSGIIGTAILGLINPSKEIETFCLSAVEFQAAGTTVVSVAEGGLLDTVIHKKTGLLGKNENQFIEYIIYLLKNPQKAIEMGENGRSFIKENFSFDLITQEWANTLSEVYNNIPNRPIRMKRNIFYRKKVLFEIDRIIYRYLSFSFLKTYIKIKHAKFI